MAFMASNFFWNEWLCHSNYSFLVGASYPQDFIERATKFAYRGMGLCDYNGVYGLVQAYDALKRSEAQVKPQFFHGIEFSLAHQPDVPLSLQETLVLYAKNKKGYRNLCTLASIAHQEGGKQPQLPLSVLEGADKEGLVCFQPMRGLIRTHSPELVYKRYRKYKEYFDENLYLILSRHLNPIEDRWISPTLALARKLEIKTLFSQDAYFHQPEEKYLHDVVQAIRLNQPLDKIMPHLFVNEERSLRDLQTLERRYSVFADATKILQDGQGLADQFEFCLSELKYHYPQEFIPEQHTPQSFLQHLIGLQSQKRYPNGLPEKVKYQLEKELWLVYELKLADYFLTVWDIVRWAREQNILCQGRGSAANSVICYILEITSLDPIASDLLFERFLSRERGEPPDIDVDFEHERREEVIQYVYSRYGRKRAAMVANVICFRGRSAFRAIGKAFGVPESWVGQIADFKSMHRRQEQKPPLPEDLKEGVEPYCNWELWQGLSDKIQGFPRHLGLHSGGFVLSDEDLDGLCPQEPATMEGRTVVQWSKDDIETLEIFKIDLLALGMLTALRKGFATIKEHYGETVEIYKIPPEDPRTFAMIQKGDTVGTFQIESRAQMSMLPRLKPRNFYDLVVQIGIIRPGPIQGGLIHPYIRRRQGLEPVTYPDDRLIPILRRTYGVPIFQEQIMRVAMAIGGFSAGEADELRKKIGAWSLGKNMDSIVPKLRQGMLDNNVDPTFAEQVIDYLQGFASYGFPESHSASFALIAYASSYIKCYFPLAFYMSIINSQPMGFYSIHALIQSARREGVKFLPPDINRSAWDSSVEYLADGTKVMRLGMHLIRGLAEKSANALIALRDQSANRQWLSLQDFTRDAMGMNRKDLSALAAADAFRGFAISRREAIWFMETFPRAPLLDTEVPYAFAAETEIERMEKDFESFTSTLDQHPIVLIKKHAWRFPVKADQLTSSQKLLDCRKNQTVFIFGMVLIRQSPPTAKGILFITLEDDTGFFNLVCKPQTIDLYRQILWQHSFLCISGRLQRDLDSVSILVEKAYAPSAEVRQLREGEKSHSCDILESVPPIRNFR